MSSKLAFFVVQKAALPKHGVEFCQKYNGAVRKSLASPPSYCGHVQGGLTSYMVFHTWAHLPYIAVLKSVHRTATVCCSIHTFFRGSKLLTLAVLWTLAKTANPGSSMYTFRSFQKVQFCDRISTTSKSVHKTAVLVHNSEK